MCQFTRMVMTSLNTWFWVCLIITNIIYTIYLQLFNHHFMMWDPSHKTTPFFTFVLYSYSAFWNNEKLIKIINNIYFFGGDRVPIEFLYFLNTLEAHLRPGAVSWSQCINIDLFGDTNTVSLFKLLKKCYNTCLNAVNL